MSHPTKAQVRMLDAMLEDQRRLKFVEEFLVSVMHMGKEKKWFGSIGHEVRHGCADGATATDVIDQLRAQVDKQISHEKANARWHKLYVQTEKQ